VPANTVGAGRWDPPGTVTIDFVKHEAPRLLLGIYDAPPVDDLSETTREGCAGFYPRVITREDFDAIDDTGCEWELLRRDVDAALVNVTLPCRLVFWVD
jgi:hypothetical protein